MLSFSVIPFPSRSLLFSLRRVLTVFSSIRRVLCCLEMSVKISLCTTWRPLGILLCSALVNVILPLLPLVSFIADSLTSFRTVRIFSRWSERSSSVVISSKTLSSTCSLLILSISLSLSTSLSLIVSRLSLLLAFCTLSMASSSAFLSLSF